jgi:hypothetical protein
MTKRLVKLRDPETVEGHSLELLVDVWPYIPREIHILVETCAIDRPALSCPVKGSRSWAGAVADWNAAVASIPFCQTKGIINAKKHRNSCCEVGSVGERQQPIDI